MSACQVALCQLIKTCCHLAVQLLQLACLAPSQCATSLSVVFAPHTAYNIAHSSSELYNSGGLQPGSSPLGHAHSCAHALCGESASLQAGGQLGGCRLPKLRSWELQISTCPLCLCRHSPTQCVVVYIDSARRHRRLTSTSPTLLLTAALWLSWPSCSLAHISSPQLPSIWKKDTPHVVALCGTLQTLASCFTLVTPGSLCIMSLQRHSNVTPTSLC